MTLSTVIVAVFGVIVMTVLAVIVIVCAVHLAQGLSWWGRRQSASIRCTTIAAPKPLSMFTTAMPDAHDVSIAASAVSPPSAAP
jgi:hypothetical protein